MLFFFSFPLPSPFSLFPANHSNFFEDSAPSGGRPCRGNPRNGFRSSAIFYLGHPRGWTEGGREGGRRRVSGGWTGTPFMPRRYYVCTWHANTSVLGQFTVILTVAICSSLSPHPPSPTPPLPYNLRIRLVESKDLDLTTWFLLHLFLQQQQQQICKCES